MRPIQQSIALLLLFSSLVSPPAIAGGTPLLAGKKVLGVKHAFVVFVANVSAEDSDLAQAIEDAIQERRERDPKYQRASSANAAARYDRDIINILLRSRGFYRADISSRIVGSDSNNEQIAHQVYPGRQFTIRKLTYDWPANVPPPPESVKHLEKSDGLVADAVLNQQNALRDWVVKTQCLRDVDVSYIATVDYELNQAELVFQLAPSPQVTFGRVSFTGQTSIEPEYLRLYVAYESGDCFKQDLLDATRLKLLQTNLIATVQPIPGDIIEGEVPVEYRLVERKHRTIGFGIGYDTDIKTQLTSNWQHRNLLGRGEQLSTELTASAIINSLEANIIVPFFRSKKQRLTINSLISDEESDAFELYKGEASVALERELHRRTKGTVGVSLGFSRLQEDDGEEDFALLSLPLRLDYNARNNLLNPTGGWTMGIQYEPFIDLYDTGTRFNRSTLAGSGYWQAERMKFTPTIAARFAVGVIDGALRDEVPRDQLFYVGGGDSVRGYSYQSVGEFDDEGRPAGGLSFSQTSLELRFRMTESIGVTLFTDGGYAAPGRSPDFGDAFLWGAGIGLRYHTSFAPFRVDFATPLDTRKDAMGKVIDDSFQLYIGIGQAF